MEAWSNERMGERGAGSGTMRPGASALDAKTVALVRAAAALAEGRITELEQRFREARAASVPDLWVEELLLQSLLLVGYPLALVGFGVWREVTGPIARGGGGGGRGARHGPTAALAPAGRVEHRRDAGGDRGGVGADRAGPGSGAQAAGGGAVGGCEGAEGMNAEVGTRNDQVRNAECGMRSLQLRDRTETFALDVVRL